jgi:hypothetical protein
MVTPSTSFAVFRSTALLFVVRRSMGSTLIALLACVLIAQRCAADEPGGAVGGAVGGNITVQLPSFGVAIDADGVLAVKMAVDPDGRLRAARAAAAKAMLPPNLLAASKLRKVSLVRLERALRAQLAAGQPPDDIMLHLAGLDRLEAVYCYPESGDLVLAGPAAGWIDDPSGRAVSLASGRPALLLVDLAAALRAYRPGTKKHLFVGCTIDPPAEGLVRFQQFQRTIPHSVGDYQRDAVAAQIAAGIEESLGLAEIRVFGIPASTHMAAVMVEADYRMKRIGIGLEPPGVPIVTFLDALGSSRQTNLQRWWFTPRYECLRVTDDALGMEMLSDSVELHAEDKVIGPAGTLLAGSPPSKPSQRFTESFTRRYPELASRSPVFAQLKQAIDFLVAAAFIREQDFYGRLSWDLGALGDESQLSIEVLDVPRKAPCVANARWKGARLQTPAGGGVSIVADEALSPARRGKDTAGKLAQRRHDVERQVPADAWWWD